MIAAKFVLILTMISQSGNSGADHVSVSQVNGFESRKSCMVAANAWLEQMRGAGHVFARMRPRALCVATQ